MKFLFQFNRALQAAAYLLQKMPNGTMDYMRLIKLLYIAERDYLGRYGEMITGDKVVAMPYGPVLSRTLDIIKETGNADRDEIEAWKRHIRRDSMNLTLVVDPGNGLLNRAIEEILDAVHERFKNEDVWGIVEDTHFFPEWLDNKPGAKSRSNPISIESILYAQDRESMIPLAEKNAEMALYAAGVFGK
ncbi:MAG: Panacea domain-containing protein [Planctomycetia bacterium]|nr:Panacea domain-containing protein [Planctomycetia bacterium]